MVSECCKTSQHQSIMNQNCCSAKCINKSPTFGAAGVCRSDLSSCPFITPPLLFSPFFLSFPPFFPSSICALYGPEFWGVPCISLIGLEIITLHCWMAKLHQKIVLCPCPYSTYAYTHIHACTYAHPWAVRTAAGCWNVYPETKEKIEQQVESKANGRRETFAVFASRVCAGRGCICT